MGIDHHREKYGTVALAKHLLTQGWEEVRLSVRPESLDSTLDGAAVPDIDPVRDATDPDYRHSIYYIHPGRVDLVARRGQELLLVEAKGTSAPPGKGVKDVIRQIVKHIDLNREDRAYGVLVPDDPAWLAVLSHDRSPALKIVTVFLVSREGAVTTWPPGPADEKGIEAAAEKEIQPPMMRTTTTRPGSRGVSRVSSAPSGQCYARQSIDWLRIYLHDVFVPPPHGLMSERLPADRVKSPLAHLGRPRSWLPALPSLSAHE